MENSENLGVPGNVILYSPEKWGEVTKFRYFFSSTYRFDVSTLAALGGVEGHFQKYDILFQHATRMVPSLAEDKKELEIHGYSNCMRSKELAAIIETLFCELYSSVDCARQVIKAVYGRYHGVPSKGTTRLFKNAFENKLDPRIPIEIRIELKDAYSDWFPKLREIRDRVVHSDVGSCGEQGGKIIYWNRNTIEQKEIKIEDALNEIDEYADKVNKFLGIIFKYLNSTLKNREMKVLCGIFDGLCYERIVESGEISNFLNDGICKSFKWFEKDGNKICPYSNECVAYKRGKQRNIGN